MRCLLHKMRSLTIKLFATTILVLTVYLFVFYLLMEIWYNPKMKPVQRVSVVLPYVMVHIDLKGSPPKLEYLETLLPMLKDNGVNGLVLEYEDMFPYEGNLMNISAKNCYDKAALEGFLRKATREGFEVVPLIQTFGHMEHVLKLEEFRRLRETDLFPDSICPSHPDTNILVKDMLEQVINFHNSIKPLKYFHIGCDEIYHINKCDKCRIRKIEKRDIFFGYVRELANIVKTISPSTTVLIWDDMLRRIKPQQWNKVDRFPRIEPVYWEYSPTLKVSHINLLNYHKKFDNIWIATAFKGADGRVATVPNFRHRYLNHFNWLSLILNYKFGGETKVYKFKGIILTGWSRYSHMDPLCELLPASIPSLMLNLQLIKRFREGIVVDEEVNSDPDEFFNKYLDADINNSLQCNDIIDIGNIDHVDYLPCRFEGIAIYNALRRYIMINADIEDGFNNLQNGLSSIEFYSTLKSINMNTVFKNIGWCKDMLQELSEVETILVDSMSRYYNNDTINEYVNYKMYNAKMKLVKTLKALNDYKKFRTWERRPLESDITEIN